MANTIFLRDHTLTSAPPANVIDMFKGEDGIWRRKLVEPTPQEVRRYVHTVNIGPAFFEDELVNVTTETMEEYIRRVKKRELFRKLYGGR